MTYYHRGLLLFSGRLVHEAEGTSSVGGGALPEKSTLTRKVDNLPEKSLMESLYDVNG